MAAGPEVPSFRFIGSIEEKRPDVDVISPNSPLGEALMGAKTVEGSQALANYYRDKVFSAMAELRITIDQLETMTPSDKWPVPSYGDLLFSVR